VWDGIILAGAPIGTEDFIHDHTKDKLRALTAKVNAMTDLSKHEAQIAYQMVVHCANHAWRYYVRVTPPAMISELIQYYDDMIMGPQGRQLDYVSHEHNQACRNNVQTSNQHVWRRDDRFENDCPDRLPICHHGCWTWVRGARSASACPP
jgi:hypothetical protein